MDMSYIYVRKHLELLFFRNEWDKLDNNKKVVGMPVVFVQIRDHFYHGLCDIGTCISDIPFSLYQELCMIFDLLR